MAATPDPEEFLDLHDHEPAPPSPSVFLDLPPTPDGDSPPQDDLALDYISRMLMEEDMDEDRLFYQYHNHPALLQAQQSLAHVLSSENAAGEAEDVLQVGNGDQAVLSSEPLSGAESLRSPCENLNVDMVNMAFLKGMEEANKFLPIDTSLAIDFTGGQANDSMARKEDRYDDWDKLEAETSRKNKLMATAAEPGEVVVREMIDQMMLEECRISTDEMEQLRAAREKEAECKKNGTDQAARRIRGAAMEQHVDLRLLLIHCAQAVMDDRQGAHDLLMQIKQHASPMGDATQRLAHCFAEGLEARLAGTGNRLYRSLMERSPSLVDFLRAYRLLIATSCFKNVAFTFANKTIFNAAVGRSRLHIVDYGINLGLHWPGLLRWLAVREGGPPEVRITGIDLPLPGFRPASFIQEMGLRLTSCAGKFGVPFKFHAIAAQWHTIHAEDLDIDPDEVLVVNSLFSFMTLMDDSVVVDGPSPRDVVLSNIREMQPDVFVHGVVNSSYGAFFLTRFREALYFYSAMFDVLEATMPRESEQRRVLERDIFGPSAVNVIACEGADRTDRSEAYRQWELRNRRAGLRQLPLDREVVETVRETMRKHQYHSDFVVNEDRRWLLQGWKGRILFAHSTWVPDYV